MQHNYKFSSEMRVVAIVSDGVQISHAQDGQF